MFCGCVQQDFGEKWHGSPSDISHILQLSNLSRLKEFETVEDQRHIAWITIALAPSQYQIPFARLSRNPKLRTLSHNGAATITSVGLCWTPRLILFAAVAKQKPSKTIIKGKREDKSIAMFLLTSQTALDCLSVCSPAITYSATNKQNSRLVPSFGQT